MAIRSTKRKHTSLSCTLISCMERRSSGATLFGRNGLIVMWGVLRETRGPPRILAWAELICLNYSYHLGCPLQVLQKIEGTHSGAR